MKDNKQKLELTWIGKHNPEYNIANIEPRILQENPELSNCKNDANTENKIIHGDNLLALKALLPEYEGKVKCIYIDPPYNTGNAFEHYDDAVEHSTWLSLMKPRLELLRLLLSEDGVIFVQLDDNEIHYCKCLCDEVFGRNNFVTSVVWKRRASQANLAKYFAPIHDHILVYSKQKTNLTLNKISLKEEYVASTYKNPDNDPRGPWRTKPLLQGKRSSNQKWELTLPDGRKMTDSWRCSKETYDKYLADNRIYIPKDGVPNIKIFLCESQGQVPNTFWEGYGTNEEAGLEIEKLFGSKKDFETPKPEKLILNFLQIASNENDLVLDSFLGSGTTAAVAHKMNRRYIGIEMGDHAYTHCKTRLDKVIAGEQGGISKAVNWQGGGAYKFYELAPSFIAKDEFGNLVIDAFYNDSKLIQAMCKLMNFSYQPSQEQYWKHGISSGKNYLFVTTQILTCALVAQIASHLGENESLIICAKNFESGAGKIDSRIAVKKIPQSVLKSCNFGKKEYLLPIKENKALEELSQNEIEEEND